MHSLSKVVESHIQAHARTHVRTHLHTHALAHIDGEYCVSVVSLVIWGHGPWSHRNNELINKCFSVKLSYTLPRENGEHLHYSWQQAQQCFVCLPTDIRQILQHYEEKSIYIIWAYIFTVSKLCLKLVLRHIAYNNHTILSVTNNISHSINLTSVNEICYSIIMYMYSNYSTYL